RLPKARSNTTSATRSTRLLLAVKLGTTETKVPFSNNAGLVEPQCDMPNVQWIVTFQTAAGTPRPGDKDVRDALEGVFCAEVTGFFLAGPQSVDDGPEETGSESDAS